MAKLTGAGVLTINCVPKFKESYKQVSKIKLYLVLCSIVQRINTKKKKSKVNRPVLEKIEILEIGIH